MKQSRLIALAVLCALLGMVLVTFSASAAPVLPLDLKTLTPGLAPQVSDTLKVNIVFVGYSPGDVNVNKILGGLPAKYNPIVRFPNFYGIFTPLGFQFKYSFNPIFAGTGFQDDFFGYLTEIGEPGPLTALQEGYNDQVHNTLDVTGPVLYIDAPSAEKWLMQHAQQQLGIGDNYTVFLVNWYGRGDFAFHVYTKTNDPDPDTGYNFGIVRPSRKMIAWGGSYGRTWFYDLSAGPEAWTDNWNVDDADADGDGSFDYRMPPVWEYGNVSGYRPFNDLSGDLSKVIRYVALDLLFTTSPLYDPIATVPPEQTGARVVAINMFDGEPNVKGADYLRANWLKARWSKFQPYYNWQVNVISQPLKSGPKNAQRIAFGVINKPGCWQKFGAPDAMLYCFFDSRRSQYLSVGKPGDYVEGVFGYNAGFKKVGGGVPLGFADDNWTNGTPSFVFMYDNAFIRDLGYGFTTTTLHEVGHHIGMSHPHDGYDSESGVDFDAVGDFYFAWSGDESATIMSYIDVNFDFGVFDRDNMDRFVFMRALDRGNQGAAQVLATGAQGQVRDLVSEADAHMTRARAAFKNKNYTSAATSAVQGYQLIQAAATRTGITLKFPEFQPVPGRIAPRMIDPIHPE